MAERELQTRSGWVRTAVRAEAAEMLKFPREGPQMLVAWLILTTLFVAWLAGGFPRVTRRAH